MCMYVYGEGEGGEGCLYGHKTRHREEQQTTPHLPSEKLSQQECYEGLEEIPLQHRNIEKGLIDPRTLLSRARNGDMLSLPLEHELLVLELVILGAELRELGGGGRRGCLDLLVQPLHLGRQLRDQPLLIGQLGLPIPSGHGEMRCVGCDDSPPYVARCGVAGEAERACVCVYLWQETGTSLAFARRAFL